MGIVLTYQHLILGFLALAALVLAPATTFASGGGMSDESFQAILILIGVTTVAFVATHFIAEWLEERYGIVTGAEYIVIGAILSPAFAELAGFDFQLLTAERLGQLSPALVLGEGSLGLLAGVILNFRARDGVSGRAFGIGLIITLCTLAVVALVPFLIAVQLIGLDEAVQFVPHLLCFGTVACVASGGTLRSLISFLDARGDAAQLVTRVARSCSSFALIAFGVIFCLSKPASDLIPTLSLGVGLDIAFWFGVHIGLGLLLGLAFALFLLQDLEDEQILTIVIGMVIFTSGVAYFLKLSPIVVCFVLGVAFANLSPRHSGQVQRMLLSVERPLYIIIYIFVGATISLSVPWWAWLAALPYLALRAAGRTIGGVLARGFAPSLRQVPPIGSALIAPGALSAAMLLSFHEVYLGQPLVDEAYAALLLALVVGEPLAHRYSRLWLIDATDVSLGREGTP